MQPLVVNGAPQKGSDLALRLPCAVVEVAP
jgi:hypothetical protein